MVLDGFVFLDGGGMLWSSTFKSKKAPRRHIAQGRTGLNLQEQLQPKPRVGWLKPVTQLQHLALQIDKIPRRFEISKFLEALQHVKTCHGVMTAFFQAEAPALLVS